MRNHLFCMLIVVCILTLCSGCQRSEDQLSPSFPAPQSTGTILGGISPITAHDAEVLIFQGDEYLRTVKVKDGAFEVKDLSPGNYRLTLVATGFFTNVSLKSVKVKAGEVADVGRVILLEKVELGWESPKISGAITDSQNQLPVSQANIRVECGDGVCLFESKSDENGRYIITVWPGLIPILTISKPGYKTFSKEFAPMLRGENRKLDVELERLR